MANSLPPHILQRYPPIHSHRLSINTHPAILIHTPRIPHIHLQRMNLAKMQIQEASTAFAQTASHAG
ncbi:hypothetical protein BC830DRAFT_1105313 [Chytriomyces sp. MP71]|nr:hypothetical protein BC830DRAFT_1105313 [Chytriomyces sp. MP71]